MPGILPSDDYIFLVRINKDMSSPEFRGEWIHVYVWLGPFAVLLKLPQH